MTTTEHLPAHAGINRLVDLPNRGMDTPPRTRGDQPRWVILHCFTEITSRICGDQPPCAMRLRMFMATSPPERGSTCIAVEEKPFR